MQTDSFEEYTAQYPDSCSDAAYTLALHREHLPHRAFAIVQDGTICETSTQIKAMGSAPPITMVFSGQGAQWPQMGRELILTTASFRGDIVRMDETLQGLRIPPRWSILGMFPVLSNLEVFHITNTDF
jgi:acyl transferase domain-containing protein